MNRNRRGPTAGFTLIEVMVGIVIIAAAAVTMYYAVTTARGQIRQIILKQRALEELSNYMDYWMARINDFQMTNYEISGDSQGEQVILYHPWENIILDPRPEEYIEGTIYRERLIQGHSANNPENQPFYVLEAYIVFDDFTTKSNELKDTLRLRTAAFSFR